MAKNNTPKQETIKRKAYNESEWKTITSAQFLKEIELDDALEVLKKTKRVKSGLATYIIE
tara:strand:- start:34 stop:213 length:180 start_codon:yes stop_codon:yes gene_type:complete